ncbi:hypothetical protein E2C06_03160 [Dankookia rubra]|uniref:Uncharacterized protein n=1 Tax=Dankookia rubra TaxID=1442381 RepID=A0A4R5QMD6_9PROT|nr:hypothetical protein [Dankookia rubra]TDH64068.1 hypothetical protein E2C06_03160 [Dankookia rubra]
MKPMTPMKPMEPMDPGPAWWPEELGQPASSGGQDGVQYAFFPDARRLAIRRDGRVTVYDSGQHRISGVAQRQGGSRAVVFSGAEGEVAAEDLREIGPGC